MDGQMGYQPAWYPVVAAARYLGVSPWDLEHQSVIWIHRAAAASAAEEHAHEMAMKKAK